MLANTGVVVDMLILALYRYISHHTTCLVLCWLFFLVLCWLFLLVLCWLLVLVLCWLFLPCQFSLYNREKIFRSTDYSGN